MKKKWVVLGAGLILLGFILVLLLIGLGAYFLFFSGVGEEVPEAPKEAATGVLVREDTNRDGAADRFTYVMPKEEVEKDVFLQRTVVYEEEGEAYKGTLTLEFENTGDEEKTITHIEKIPKSYAADVKDLTFSVPPTEILEEDPKVSWEMRVRERNKAAIKIGAAIDLGVGKVKEAWSQWLGKEAKPSEEDAVAGAVMEGVGDIHFEADLAVTEKYAETQVAGRARTDLVSAYPEKFVLEDCEDIGGANDKNSKWLCRAVLTGDWTECANSDASKVDACKENLYISLKVKKCMEIKDTTLKDLCIYKAAVKADWDIGCSDIADREKLYLKEECLAEVTQDMSHCKKIPEKKIKENCCRKLMNPDEQAECLGINTTTTTTLYHLPTKLELLMQTNALDVNAGIYGRGIDKEDGVAKEDLSSTLFHCQTQGNLTWNGRIFSGSMSWEREDSGRVLKYRQVLEGAVTEEGDKIVWLTCEWYRDDFDDPQATEEYRHKFQVSNVPINQTAYGPHFGAEIRGPELRHYFSQEPESYDKQTRGKKVYEYTHFEEIIWEPPKNTDIENKLFVTLWNTST